VWLPLWGTITHAEEAIAVQREREESRGDPRCLETVGSETQSDESRQGGPGAAIGND